MLTAPFRALRRKSVGASLASSIFAFALSVASLAAQAQMPNECCPVIPVEGPIHSCIPDDGERFYLPFVVQPPPTVTFPSYATVMLEPGLLGVSTTADPVVDGAVVFLDPGRGTTNADTYGGLTRLIPMPVVESGLVGLGNLYHSLFVIDVSRPAWDGSGTHLRSLSSSYELPVPWMNASDLDGGGFAVQPRPGTMPGLYILQVGGSFYHYGSPLETGANPQSTAMYLESNVQQWQGGGEEDDDEDEKSRTAIVGKPSRGPSASPRPATPTILYNQLTGAWLYLFPAAGSTPAYVEVRHVDGTVARFDSFDPYVSTWTPSGPTRKLWRLTEVRDTYDNVATYAYNTLNQLTSITFPSGISQHFAWSSSSSLSWPNWSSSDDRVEISYQYNSTSPTEVAARTWGLVFQSSGSAYGGRHFGGRLFRTYSPSRNSLAEMSSVGPYTSVSSANRAVQIVHEFAYVPASGSNPAIMVETQRAHSGTPFDATITSPSDLPNRDKGVSTSLQ